MTANPTNATIAKNRSVKVKQQKISSNGVSAGLKELTRDELETEVMNLRGMVASMKRAETIDPVSGLVNRSVFLDLANAEFARSRRYEHELTLVVTDIVGLSRVVAEHGENAADTVITSVSQMCVSSSRLGVDILGRISDNQLAIMLPETPLAGGLKCIERLRKIITSTPIRLEDGTEVKPGMKVAVDTLVEDDRNFSDLFDRTSKRTPKRKPQRTAA